MAVGCLLLFVRPVVQCKHDPFTRFDLSHVAIYWGMVHGVSK